MKKLFLFFIFIFIFILNRVTASEVFSPYRIVGQSYRAEASSVKIIENMPKIRSQGALGLCYAFSSATLLQKYYCDDVQIEKCEETLPNQTISPIAITGLKQAVAGKTDANDIKTYAHAFLPTKDLDNGGSAVNLLANASVQHLFCAESFFPFDQFVGMNNFANLDPKTAQAEMGKLANGKILELEKTYKKYHAEATSVESCTECLKEIRSIAPINGRDELIQGAFKKNTFQEFLYEAFFRSCTNKIKLKKPTFDYYPKDDLVVNEKEYFADRNNAVKNEFLGKIKKVLSNNVPLQISFCAEKTADICTGFHVAVVSGHKKMCKENNQCVDMLKIHNSYGMAWQDVHNDGWVVADYILNALIVSSKNKIDKARMSWIAKGTIN